MWVERIARLRDSVLLVIRLCVLLPFHFTRMCTTKPIVVRIQWVSGVSGSSGGKKGWRGWCMGDVCSDRLTAVLSHSHPLSPKGELQILSCEISGMPSCSVLSSYSLSVLVSKLSYNGEHSLSPYHWIQPMPCMLIWFLADFCSSLSLDLDVTQLSAITNGLACMIFKVSHKSSTIDVSRFAYGLKFSHKSADYIEFLHTLTRFLSSTFLPSLSFTFKFQNVTTHLTSSVGEPQSLCILSVSALWKGSSDPGFHRPLVLMCSMSIITVFLRTLMFGLVPCDYQVACLRHRPEWQRVFYVFLLVVIPDPTFDTRLQI